MKAIIYTSDDGLFTGRKDEVAAYEQNQENAARQKEIDAFAAAKKIVEQLPCFEPAMPEHTDTYDSYTNFYLRCPEELDALMCYYEIDEDNVAFSVEYPQWVTVISSSDCIAVTDSAFDYDVMFTGFANIREMAVRANDPKIVTDFLDSVSKQIELLRSTVNKHFAETPGQEENTDQ